MQSPSHIRPLSLAFFHYSMECKGQAYTAIWIPHRSGSRESQKQLSELLATTSTKWSYTYCPERHTCRLCSTHF